MTPDQLLAMDMALGALDREARKAAEARMHADPAFRADVEQWQALLAPLNEDLDPVLPPAAVWAGVQAEVMSPPLPSQMAVAPALAPARSGLWHSLALWRTLGLAGPALAALALLLAPPSAPPATPSSLAGAPPAVLAASLRTADGTPLIAATFDPLRGAVILTPASPAAGTDLVPELWVIEGKAAPRSLGLIALDAPSAHAISSQRISGLQPGAVLAISMEPIGGSPTGLPTGPVIATGALSPV